MNDSVTSLKLLEKGLHKEDLAVAVLLDFPAQMVAGWLAAKWSRPAPVSRHALSGNQNQTSQVLRPWLFAFWARLIMATVATLVVWGFPTGNVSSGYFGIIIATTLLSSVSRYAILDGDLRKLMGSTVQFVGITAFHTQIADPLIGGTYMTVSLMGLWNLKADLVATQHNLKSRRHPTQTNHPPLSRRLDKSIMLHNNKRQVDPRRRMRI